MTYIVLDARGRGELQLFPPRSGRYAARGIAQDLEGGAWNVNDPSRWIFH